jgi:hypothetical protein
MSDIGQVSSRLCRYAMIAFLGAYGTHPRAHSEPSVDECTHPKPDWIWCDDFEENRLGKYFEYVNPQGRFLRTRGAGVSGSYGMSARYPTTAPSAAGQLHLAFGKTPNAYFRPVDAGVAIYREIYWRLYVLHPTQWVGDSPDKLSRAISFGAGTWAEAMVAHVWNGGYTQLAIDPASGTDEAGNVMTTGYNDGAHFRWLGAAVGATNLFDGAHLGRWVCVEAHVRLNDPGVSNGLFELWVDGNADASRTGLNWVGAFSAYGINSLFVENYRNDASPVEQSRYLDNLVVSTRRIGC